MLAPVLFGGNGVAARLAVNAVPPLVLVTLRWAIVVAALGLLLRKDDRRELVVLLRNHPWRFGWMGLLGFSGFNALYYIAAYSTTAVNLTLLQCLIPVLVLAGAAAVFRIRISALQIVGMTLTIVGALVVAFKGDLRSLSHFAINRGDGLVLITCVFYAAYILGLRVRPPGSALVFFAGLAISSLLWSLPMSIGEITFGHAYWPSLKGWLAALFIAFGPSFAAQVFFLRGVDLVGPARAGLFTNLTPIFGGAGSGPGSGRALHAGARNCRRSRSRRHHARGMERRRQPRALNRERRSGERCGPAIGRPAA